MKGKIIIGIVLIVLILLLLTLSAATSNNTAHIFSNEDGSVNVQDVTWFDDEVTTKYAIQAAQTTIHNINTSEKFLSIRAAIDDSDTLNGHIIEVEDGVYNETVKITKSLTIRSENGSGNCIVQSIEGYPVFIIMANRVNISGFTVKGATGWLSAGIYINASYCNISNNNCQNNTLGIILDRNSSGNIIICNNISLNHWTGISLWSSNNNSIFYNNISNNGLNPDPNVLRGGIILSGSNNNITGNTFIDDGIYASFHDRNNVKNNIVNDKPLVYLENESDCTITNAGQVILIGCDNITLRDLDLSHTVVGVQLRRTVNSTIMNNTMNSNNMHGVQIDRSSNISIINNSINSNKKHGIYLSLFTSGNQISHNYINSNKMNGIHMCISSGNTITNNNISLNNKDGITCFFSSDNNIINRNNINYNNRDGIRLYVSSSNNLIYLNNFINNTDNVYQKDSSNLWYFPLELNYSYNGSNFTGSVGNFWDDYKGNDTGNDGIGDTPYRNNSDMDNYPLMERFDSYNVSEPNFIPGDNTQIHINAQELVSGTFNVMIDIYNVADLKSGQFNLSFNSSVVNVDDISAGDMNGFAIRNSWELIDNDTICIVFNLSDIGISGSGQLATIRFETIGSQGDIGTLNISNINLTDTTGDEIPVTWFNDEITIGVPVTVNAPASVPFSMMGLKKS